MAGGVAVQLLLLLLVWWVGATWVFSSELAVVLGNDRSSGTAKLSVVCLCAFEQAAGLSTLAIRLVERDRHDLETSGSVLRLKMDVD